MSDSTVSPVHHVRHRRPDRHGCCCGVDERIEPLGMLSFLSLPVIPEGEISRRTGCMMCWHPGSYPYRLTSRRRRRSIPVHKGSSSPVLTSLEVTHLLIPHATGAWSSCTVHPMPFSDVMMPFCPTATKTPFPKSHAPNVVCVMQHRLCPIYGIGDDSDGAVSSRRVGCNVPRIPPTPSPQTAAAILIPGAIMLLP